MKKVIFLFCFLLVASGCNSVLTGDNQSNQIDGRIDDADISTGPGKTYSSQGDYAERSDGLSQANSHVVSYKRLHGLVDIALAPNSQGPFTGTPDGFSNQKVRSTFRVDKMTDVRFELDPRILVDINGAGRAKVEILMWVLDGVIITATAVPGSIFTVTYTFQEDPNNIDTILYTIANSDGLSQTGSIADNQSLYDRWQLPDPFELKKPGKYTVQYEMNIQAGGDTDKTSIDSTCKFDLVKR